MKRLVLSLVLVAAAVMAPNAASAHGYRHRPCGPGYGYRYGGYYRPPVVRYYPPPVPYGVYPAPVYTYPYRGFNYAGPNFAIGFGY